MLRDVLRPSGLYLCLVTMLLLACCLQGAAQSRELRKGTSNTNRKIGDPGAGGQFRDRSIDYIIKTNKGKIQTDNCVMEMSRKMGFEYMLIPDGQATFGQKVGFFFNNLWIKTKLTFTKGPFWKISFNHKVKKCRNLAGDYVGDAGEGEGAGVPN